VTFLSGGNLTCKVVKNKPLKITTPCGGGVGEWRGGPTPIISSLLRPPHAYKFITLQIAGNCRRWSLNFLTPFGDFWFSRRIQWKVLTPPLFWVLSGTLIFGNFGISSSNIPHGIFFFWNFLLFFNFCRSTSN